jgi:hypothetical protein
MGLPQLLTGLDVEQRQAEENDCEQEHHQILHGNSCASVSLSAKALIGTFLSMRKFF